MFLVLGSGFFDYDGSWAIPDFGYDDYFRLKLNGYDSTMIPTNALIRAQVENKQFGWIPKFSYDHVNGQLIIGGELEFIDLNTGEILTMRKIFQLVLQRSINTIFTTEQKILLVDLSTKLIT